MNNKVEIDIVRNEEDLHAAMELRRINFVENQHISPEAEFDGNDFSATHILAKVNDKPSATMRIRYFKDFVRLERFCKTADCPVPDIVKQVLDYTKNFLAEKGYTQTHCYCKEELAKHWLSNGHRQLAEAQGVEMEGMKLVPISLDIAQPDHCVTINSSPEILTAQEGRWKLPSSSQTAVQTKAAIILNKRNSYRK